MKSLQNVADCILDLRVETKTPRDKSKTRRSNPWLCLETKPTFSDQDLLVGGHWVDSFLGPVYKEFRDEKWIIFSFLYS